MFFFSCVLIHIFYKWNDLLFYFTSWFDWFCSLIMKKYNWIFNKFSVFMEFGESFYFCTNHNLIEQVNCVAKNVWFNAEMVNFLLMELLLLERNNLNLSCTHFRENLAINEAFILRSKKTRGNSGLEYPELWDLSSYKQSYYE